jgi:hypothetical protein
MMQRVLGKRREEFYAGTNGFRFQCIAERYAQTECSKFNRAFLQVNPVNLVKKVLKDGLIGPFPLIAAAPVQDQTLIGLDEEHARTTAWIENDFILLLQPVEPFPAE